MVLFLVVTISILNHNNIKISVAKRLFVYTPWFKDISDLQNNANQYILPKVYFIQTGFLRLLQLYDSYSLVMC